MKILSILNNLVEKSMYYVEINLLLLFSSLFILFCLFNIIIVVYYDAPTLLLWDVYVIFLFKYLVICTTLLGIFILNILTLKKHISFDKKLPRWYKIFFRILLIVNILWFICISPFCYDIIYDTIHGIH